MNSARKVNSFRIMPSTGNEVIAACKDWIVTFTEFQLMGQTKS